MQEVFIEVSKAVFAICDSESMYIYNLMEYVHSRKGEEFEVQAFTGVESLCACAKEKTIEILLISGKLLCEQVRELHIRKVMVLSEGEQICELSEYSAVYKYQPADSLIAEVMDSYARVKEAPAAALFKPEVEVTSIKEDDGDTGSIFAAGRLPSDLLCTDTGADIGQGKKCPLSESGRICRF